MIANVVEEELSPTRPQWQESSTGNGHGAPGEQWQISDSEGFFGLVEYLPKTSFTASSQFEPRSYPPHRSRLSSGPPNGCWCPKCPNDDLRGWSEENPRTTNTPWLQLDLTEICPIYAFGTKGNAYLPQRGEWVTKFTVELSQDGKTWHVAKPVSPYSEASSDFLPHLPHFPENTFCGNTDPTTEVVNRLAEPEMAQYVRFHVKEYKRKPCLRVEVYSSAEAEKALQMAISSALREGRRPGRPCDRCSVM